MHVRSTRGIHDITFAFPLRPDPVAIFVLSVYDFLTQQFIAFTRKLREIIDPIRKELNEISNQIELAATEYRAKNAKNNTPQVMRGELHRSQTEIDKEDARAVGHEGRDRVRLVVETLGVVFAFIVAFANVFLWIQTRHAVHIAAISADAAQQSAKASRDQVEITKQTVEATVNQFQLDQRAWLGVSDMNINKFASVTPLELQFILINSGKTPARNVRARFKFVFSDKPLLGPPLGWHADTINKLAPSPPQGIATYMTDSRKNGFFLGQDLYGRIVTLQEFAYEFVELEYEDTFDRTHSTRFCVQLLRLTTGARIGSKLPVMLAYCGNGNDMD